MKLNLIKYLIAFTFATLSILLVAFSSCAPSEGEGPCDFECNNGGEKVQYEDYCHCECPPGYEGEYCQIPPE